MMYGQGESSAALILRLLLDGLCEPWSDGEVRWEELRCVAERNVVLVRLAERLEPTELEPPRPFTDAVAKKRRLNGAKLDLIRRIAGACTEGGIEFILAKAFQHYPDMGDDIDLFIQPRSIEADALILNGLNAAPLTRALRNRMAGTANYRVSGCEALVEIHHGRMGMVGEHTSQIGRLIQNGRHIKVEGTEFLIPSPEDQLIIQGMQRVYRRSYLRLSDIFYTTLTFRRDTLDWDYIIRAATRLGTFEGLCCYLSYADQIHRRLLGKDMISSPLRQRLILKGWGSVRFEDGVYRFPRARVANYINKFRSALFMGDWKTAGRLCLLPLLACDTAYRRLALTLNERRDGQEGANLRIVPANERS
jgi:Uncharacterised nucleotidyltransferase